MKRILITGGAGFLGSHLAEFLLGLVREGRLPEGRPDLAREEVARLDRDRLAGIRNRTLGFVFQSFQLLPSLTALENVMMPLLVARRDRSQTREIAVSLLREVGLEPRLLHRPSELSGGEQQMLVIGRALMARPKLMLLDEPSLGLAPLLVQNIYEIIQRICA